MKFSYQLDLKTTFGLYIGIKIDISIVYYQFNLLIHSYLPKKIT